jgi:hypothetical protein
VRGFVGGGSRYHPSADDLLSRLEGESSEGSLLFSSDLGGVGGN